MPLHAERAARPPAKALADAGPQGRPLAAQRPALWHALQLRAARAARTETPQAAPSREGLPAPLKAGIERLSGIAMDDVRVHRNSAEPAKLGALAYAQGNAIHLGPGQERHLPHEAWHVVQQKQGRVQATAQAKGAMINDSAALEAEADRMGAMAGAGPDGPARAPKSVEAGAGPVQLRKFIPSENGCAAAVQGSDVAGVGTDQPSMWSFTLASSEQQPLANRDAALARVSEIYAKVGADTAGGYYMTRFNVDANRGWFLQSQKIFVPGWSAINLDHYRNVAAYNAIDPFVLTTAIKYSHQEKPTDQVKTCNLTLRTQFAHEFTGYIVGVKDDELGVDDSMEKRNRFDANLVYVNARPASTTYSNKHHASGIKSVKDLLPATKTIAATDREAGVDAITKLVAEGGRFAAVKAMGSELADDTVFHTASGQKRRGVRFSDLWGCWSKSFDKQYSISVDALKTKVANVSLVHTSKAHVVYDFTDLPQGVQHFDLDTGQKGRGAPPPQPVVQPPASNSPVMTVELTQQPKSSSGPPA